MDGLYFVGAGTRPGNGVLGTQGSERTSWTPTLGTSSSTKHIFYKPDTTNGSAIIYAYIDPQNHHNLGIYGSPMECLGKHHWWRKGKLHSPNHRPWLPGVSKRRDPWRLGVPIIHSLDGTKHHPFVTPGICKGPFSIKPAQNGPGPSIGGTRLA